MCPLRRSSRRWNARARDTTYCVLAPRSRQEWPIPWQPVSTTVTTTMTALVWESTAVCCNTRVEAATTTPGTGHQPPTARGLVVRATTRPRAGTTLTFPWRPCPRAMSRKVGLATCERERDTEREARNWNRSATWESCTHATNKKPASSRFCLCLLMSAVPSQGDEIRSGH